MKKLLAVYAFLVCMMLAWGFGARAQFGSNTRILKADEVDSNTASQITILKTLRLNTLTASRVPFLDANKDFVASAITPTELGYLSGVTSAIQTQLGAKVELSDNNTWTGTNDFQARITATGTDFSTVPCPKMTEAQRDALATPASGDCVYNATSNQLNIYDGTGWAAAGGAEGAGGIAPWEASTEYEFDDVVFLKDDNVYKIYSAKTAFTSGATFDVTNWSELSKARIDDKELLNDPGFEYGVSEWSCTNATVSQVTNTSTSSLDHGVGTGVSAAKITVTADGGYCEIVKTIGTSQAGTYVPSIYYASSSANAFIEFARDSRARVVDGLDFINSGDYEFLSAQLIASTGLSVRLGGNNTDVIYADMASMELGGYTRNASKNCSGVLDCENTFSAKVSSTGVVSDENQDWIEGNCSGFGTSSFACLPKTDTFSVTPNCWAEINQGVATGTTEYSDTSTADTLNFTMRNEGSGSNLNFLIFCQKQGTDYKTTEDKGVTIIPDNKDARLVVTNEGTTTDVSVSTTPINIPFDTIKDSNLISWDTAGNEGTFVKSGLYELDLNLELVDGADNSINEIYPEIDSGAGFIANPIDDSSCISTTRPTDSVVSFISCKFLIRASKGDDFRVRVISDVTPFIFNSTGKYPRMIITPLGGGEAVVENTKRVEFGVEQWFGEYYGGEKVYEYCNEVAADITAVTTLATLPTGLRPVGHPNISSTIWTIMREVGSGSSSDLSNIDYNASSGDIVASGSGTWKVGAGTVYCLKYRKP